MPPKSKKAPTRPSARAAWSKAKADAPTLSMRKPLGSGATLSQQRRKHAEEEDWVKQYWQGRNVKELGGMGCGLYTFGTADKILDFKSPYNGLMRMEIMSDDDVSGGSIILCVPDSWYGYDESELIMLLPFCHIGTPALSYSSDGLPICSFVHRTGFGPTRRHPEREEVSPHLYHTHGCRWSLIA